jgi:hypothetical protein
MMTFSVYIYIYIYIERERESIRHIYSPHTRSHHGASQDPFATHKGGSVWPGYNIPAVSYNSDSTSFAT